VQDDLNLKSLGWKYNALVSATRSSDSS